jgi:hypothetical protein
MLIIAGVIAALLPLLFLYIIYALDLYSSGSFRTVAACFVWRSVAFGPNLALNTGSREWVLEGAFHVDPVQSLTVGA